MSSLSQLSISLSSSESFNPVFEMSFTLNELARVPGKLPLAIANRRTIYNGYKNLHLEFSSIKSIRHDAFFSIYKGKI